MGFSASPSLTLPTRRAHGVACADIDRDGWLDLILCGFSNDELMIFRGSRDGFSAKRCQRIKLHSTGGGTTAGNTGGGEIITSQDGQQLTYVVQRGDTLSGIARVLKVSVSSLRAWNNLSGSNIKPGQRLVAYKGQGS